MTIDILTSSRNMWGLNVTVSLIGGRRLLSWGTYHTLDVHKVIYKRAHFSELIHGFVYKSMQRVT